MVPDSDRFWDVICAFTPVAHLLFIINTILLLLSVYSWYFGEANTASSVMVYVNSVVVFVNLLVLHYVIRRCRSRR